MLIIHSRPSGVSVAVTGSTGAALATSSAELFDGRPDSVTRFTWPSGAQTTSTVLRLQLTWGAAQVLRGWALLNTSLPEGTRIVVALKRPADSGFTYSPASGTEQRVVTKPRGERLAMGVFPAGLDAAIGIELAIYNDVNGSASITASSAQDVGEIVIGSGSLVDHEKSWAIDLVDPTIIERSESSQPWAQAQPPYRELSWTPAYLDEGAVFGDAAAPTVEDFEELWAKLDRGQQALFIPRYLDAAGAYSAQLLHRSAIFGTARKAPQTKHLAGPLYGFGEVLVTEAPIPT